MPQGRVLAAGLGAAFALAVIVVAFDSVWPDWTGLKGRTLWDIADLVLVPLSLAAVAYLLSAAQRSEDRAIADRQRAADRELARTREQYDTVQDYLSVITDLIRSGPLEDERLRSVARSRTLTVLGGLDGNGKRTVLRFLQEAGLIAAPSPTIDLNGADLHAADLSGTNLANAELSGVDLTDANLRGAGLGGALLRFTNLQGADLTGAYLVRAKVGAAMLDEKTRFDEAIVIAADFSEPYPYRRSEVARVGQENKRRAEEDWLTAIREASWQRAAFDYSTKWPEGFSAAEAGAHDRSD
jgi:uncharacterized protein YjbI with pentapeptide repeats